MKDIIEVEQKFRVEDHKPFVDKLPTDLAPTAFGQQTLEVDIYYQHPFKDYTKTDELLRIRNWREIIYKGPKIHADAKARLEYTWSADDGQLFLETLGFTKLIEVHKGRTTGKWACQKDGMAYTVTIALDKIAGLGNFIEIEIVTDKKNLNFAVDRVNEIAKSLGLEDRESKSYCELMLEKKCPPPQTSQD